LLTVFPNVLYQQTMSIIFTSPPASCIKCNCHLL